LDFVFFYFYQCFSAALLRCLPKLQDQRKWLPKRVSTKSELLKRAVPKKARRKNCDEKQTRALKRFPPKIEEEFEGDGEERRNWFVSQRMYPFDDVPPDARRKALNRPAPEMKQDSPQSDGAPQWKSIGPTPTSTLYAQQLGSNQRTDQRSCSFSGKPRSHSGWRGDRRRLALR
jgi:hypothetical protein